MKHLLLIAALTVPLLLPPGAHASYLEDPEDAPPPPRSDILPQPRPLPDNALTKLIERIIVHPGHTRNGLTVYPLTLPKVIDETDYLSLEEALRLKDLIITEKDRESVPTLLAQNVGKRYVLLLGGDLLAGGKQNRTLRTDVLLPPESGKVELPVYCVERGRWRGRRSSFEHNPALAAPMIRADAQADKSQEEIWSAVSGYATTLGISSETEDLTAVLDSPEVQRAVADVRNALSKSLPRRTVGLVVAHYGRIVGADVFANPAVFQKHRDRLLGSYALDCCVRRVQPPRLDKEMIALSLDPRHAERFLRRVLHADHAWLPTPGAGRLLRVTSPSLNGMALVRRDTVVVHAGLFPQDLIRPLPQPRPIPLPMPPQEFEE